MERASDGRRPSDNVSRTDGVLGTLQSVGSALLESVSSMGSPQRPDPGQPPSAEQNVALPEQQQQPAEVHATNQPGGARLNTVSDGPYACSEPVLTAANDLQTTLHDQSTPSSCMTSNEQGIPPPLSSAHSGLPGFDSRSYALSSEAPLPGFQPPAMPETPAYRTYQGGAVLQNGYAMPATPCPTQTSYSPSCVTDAGGRGWNAPMLAASPPQFACSPQQLSQAQHANAQQAQHEHQMHQAHLAQQAQWQQAQQAHQAQQWQQAGHAHQMHQMSTYVTPNHVPYVQNAQPPMQHSQQPRHQGNAHPHQMSAYVTPNHVPYVPNVQSPTQHSQQPWHQGIAQQRTSPEFIPRGINSANHVQTPYGPRMDQPQHVSTQQTPMFAHQQQQAATFAERVQSWFGSPHPQQQTAPQIGQLDARAALHGGQEAIKRVPNLEKRELELCVLDLTPRSIAEWYPLFVQTVLVRDLDWKGRISMLLSCTENSVGPFVSSDPIAAAANLWLARSAFMCLDPLQPKVKTYKQRLINNPSLNHDGVAFIAAVLKLSKYELGATERKAREAWLAKKYLSVGLGYDEAEYQVRECASEFERLTLYTDETSLHLAIIGKLPREFQAEKEDLETEIYDAESTKTGLKYDREKLIVLLASKISRGPKDKGSQQRVAAAVEDAAKAAKEAAAAGRTGDEKSPRVCVSCGSKDHITKDCTKKCGKCDLKYCPGVRGAASCVVKSGKDVPKSTQNALGKDMPYYLHNKLVAANAQERGIEVPKRGLKEASATERECEPCEAVDDEAQAPELSCGLTSRSCSAIEMPPPPSPPPSRAVAAVTTGIASLR